MKNEKIIQISEVNGKTAYLTSEGRILQYLRDKSTHRKVLHPEEAEQIHTGNMCWWKSEKQEAYYYDEYDYAWQDITPNLKKIKKYEQ